MTRPLAWLRILAPALIAGLAVVAIPADTEDKALFLVQPYLQLPTPTNMTILWETNRKQPGQVELGLTPDLGLVVESKRDLHLHEVVLKELKPATTYHYRVRSADLVSETRTFRTAAPSDAQRWRFAVYGDSRSFPIFHKRVAEQIARAKPDLIVHTGDIVANGKNRDSWRREFFEPLGELIRTTPWVSTIGNHERNADSYFQYAALPGNEHYFALDFANVHLICLDSNSWFEKGRDSAQSQWLVKHLSEKRPPGWTFVVFHHPLFSAHYSRPVHAQRWQWAPLFLDPANRVDAVLTGHDHFYARNYRMGRLGPKPQPGVLFLTTAGGGAPLYRTNRRDYVAFEKPAYHFTLLEGDGDRVTFTAIDTTGREMDRYVLTREPTPADEFCAYDIEELRDFLRRALAAAAPLRLAPRGPSTLDSELSVPTRFQVPVSGKLIWDVPRGWTMKAEDDFALKPGQPLKVPLKAEVAAGAHARTPRLTIGFAPGRFRNNRIEVSPFQLAGPAEVDVRATERPPVIDGQLTEACWQAGDGLALLGLPPDGGRDDAVHLRADADFVYLGANLSDPAYRVMVKARDQASIGDRGTINDEHVRLILANDKETHTFAVTPEQVRSHDVRGDEERPITWAGIAGRSREAWQVEMAVPRSLFPDWSAVRVNVVHRRRGPRLDQEMHLCPTWSYMAHPDLLPDVRFDEVPSKFARLKLAR